MKKLAEGTINLYGRMGEDAKNIPESLRAVIPGTKTQVDILSRVFSGGQNEGLNAVADMGMEFYDVYQKRFNELTMEQQIQMATYTKGFGMSTQQVAAIAQRQIQRTGKAGTEMLENISAYSKQVAAVTGVSYKQISQGVAKLITNVKTFGNIQEDEAARIAGTLQQLGVSYESFGSMVNKFMSFDSAASEIGKLTSVFGLHMDAMEMMQLANEDEEAFLHRMRDAFDEQGIAMDDLSKAQRNMVASTLNLKEGEIENFFSGDLLSAGVEEMEAATAEADLSSAFKDMIANAEYTEVAMGALADAAKRRALLPFAEQATVISREWAGVKQLGVGKLAGSVEDAAAAAAESFGMVQGVVEGFSDPEKLAEKWSAEGGKLADIAEVIQNEGVFAGVAKAFESPEMGLAFVKGMKGLATDGGEALKAGLVKVDYSAAVAPMASQVGSAMAGSVDIGLSTAGLYPDQPAGASLAGLSVGDGLAAGINDVVTNQIQPSLSNLTADAEIQTTVVAEVNQSTVESLSTLQVAVSNQGAQQAVVANQIQGSVDSFIKKAINPLLEKLTQTKIVNISTNISLDGAELWNGIQGHTYNALTGIGVIKGEIIPTGDR